MQRQTFLRPMKTVNFEKTLQGSSVWLLCKLGYLIYLLCTGLPILFYIVCLFLMAVKREASITLSIIMAAMINPLVAIPIGVSMKTIGQFFTRKLIPNAPTTKLGMTVLRIITYSLNCHLTLIAALTYYLFMVWIDSEQSSSVNFSNLPYNLCFCELLTELGFGQDYCANCLIVCRLSSGSACNIHGTINCSTTLCNCKLENEGDLCQKCNWREFCFAVQGIDGAIDPISGQGVTCQKGIFQCKS